MVKYWPEIGKCGYLVWRYLLRRDDQEPAPWTPEGLERTQKLGLTVQVRRRVRVPLLLGLQGFGHSRLSPACPQYPPGYLAAMANKTKKEACTRPGRGGRSKHYSGRGRPRRQRKIKEEKEQMDGVEEGEQPVASVKEEEPPNKVKEKTPRGSSGGCF